MRTLGNDYSGYLPNHGLADPAVAPGWLKTQINWVPSWSVALIITWLHVHVGHVICHMAVSYHSYIFPLFCFMHLQNNPQ